MSHPIWSLHVKQDTARDWSNPVLLCRNFRMNAKTVRYLLCSIAVLGALAQPVLAADILITDAKSEPESLTVGPGGVLIVGSASKPFVYKVAPGASSAEQFIDASAEGPGTFFFGMLADAPTNTLWTC